MKKSIRKKINNVCWLLFVAGFFGVGGILGYVLAAFLAVAAILLDRVIPEWFDDEECVKE